MSETLTDMLASGAEYRRCDAAVAQLVDLDRYPIDDVHGEACQALIAQCRAQLESDAIAMLPGFIRADALESLAAEASSVVNKGHRFDAPRATNFFDLDPGGLDEWQNLVNQRHRNRYCQVLNHDISNSSQIRRIYRWPALTEFIRQILGENTLYASQCPHLALTMKVAFEGDCDGWHYDPNDGVITLLLQSADEGGEFEYAPYLRSESEQNYAGVKQVFDNPDEHARQIRQQAGTFTLFNGSRSMHRVRPVLRTDNPRIVVIFSYDTDPDHVFSQTYIDWVRSFPQGAPESLSPREPG